MTATQGKRARESRGTRVMPPASETTSASAKAVVERGVRHHETQKPTAWNAGHAVAMLVILFLAGCSVTTGYRKPDGTVRITNWRLLWTTEAADFQTHAPDGFTTRLKLGKSATDAATVGSVSEGAVKALTRP